MNRSSFLPIAVAFGAALVLIVQVLGRTSAVHSHSDASAAVSQSSVTKQESFSLALQSRDQNGNVALQITTIEPRRIGIVVVDPWNYHWCKTATMRVDSLIPRINRALSAGRALGMTVMLCPSDVVENYVGFAQREVVLAMRKRPSPQLKQIDCPAPPDGGGCACGHDRCVPNYGWDAMHPDLKIGADDLMPDTLEEVWTICQDRKLTHLIYVGVHTQVCLLGKPMGLRNLKAAGMNCILARDMTDAHPGYAPDRDFTPDSHTAEVVAHFERHLSPTINFAEELAKIGKWDRAEVIDPVRIAPWGTPKRSHLFAKDVTVTLSAPLQPGAELRYTTDGSEPTPRSPQYHTPLKLTNSAYLRVAAFANGKRVCRDSEGSFYKLIDMPPEPDIPLSAAKMLRAVGPGHTYAGQGRIAPHMNAAQQDKSNEGKPLVLRGVKYDKGYGVHAINQLMFAIEPQYERFVALAGVDEHILATSSGSNVAMYPSVVFTVFIDGREAARSPVMRIATEPWRFDVKIPPGSRIITLSATDAGDGNKEDLANWVRCGFVTKSKSGR